MDSARLGNALMASDIASWATPEYVVEEFINDLKSLKTKFD